MISTKPAECTRAPSALEIDKLIEAITVAWHFPAMSPVRSPYFVNGEQHEAYAYVAGRRISAGINGPEGLLPGTRCTVSLPNG